MITRRELNSVLGLAFTTLFSGSSNELRAGTFPPQQNAPDRTSPAPPPGTKYLMQDSLSDITDAEASVLILTVPPHNPSSSTPHAPFPAHEHSGPVFAYILEGAIENQVEPDPPTTYHAGDFFHEPTMHVHRMLRNLSDTEPAKLLIFQIVPKGKPAAILVK
jgi:Cupin domain